MISLTSAVVISMNRPSYFVFPSPDGGWVVKRMDDDSTRRTFESRAQAIAYAKLHGYGPRERGRGIDDPAASSANPVYTDGIGTRRRWSSFACWSASWSTASACSSSLCS